jgi:hypothetical protein
MDEGFLVVGRAGFFFNIERASRSGDTGPVRRCGTRL